ncbi:hypothetical protein THIOSC15_2050015 [uncultured Thiomicrorhabdus sp.]
MSSKSACKAILMVLPMRALEISDWLALNQEHPKVEVFQLSGDQD